jgi:hypothetical protein
MEMNDIKMCSALLIWPIVMTETGSKIRLFAAVLHRLTTDSGKENTSKRLFRKTKHLNYWRCDSLREPAEIPTG